VNNRTNSSEHIVEQISPYLDGALDDATSDSVRAHIEGCAECRAEYVEMRYTRQLLRSVSAVQPPRAFTLTQEMVARRGWLWRRLLVPRNVPRLATGSVMTFALVALLLASNLGGIFSLKGTVNQDAVATQKMAAAPAQLTPGGIMHYNTPSTPSDPFNLEASAGTPAAPMNMPRAAATSQAAFDVAAQGTATVPVAVIQMGNPESTEVPSGGGTARTEAATALPPQQAVSPPGELLRISESTDNASLPQTAQPSPDGGQVLTFALMSLLVALGGVLAVGAVVAARR
jgi:anti-sigma factor RsiW